MESWGFLTNHARVLLHIAQDPGARLRDIAVSLGITERSAYGIVTDLTQAGYVVKQKDGRRNRYQIQAHLPLPDPAGQEPAIGDVLATLMGEHARQQPTGSRPRPASTTAAAATGRRASREPR
jgi:MarR family protein